MSRFSAWIRSNRLAASLIGGVVVLLVGIVAFLGVAKATDQPSFCGSACHEMGPYHAAWSSGAHKSIACVDCHVDAGQTARLTHKFEAMQEVIAHFSGKTKFPRIVPAVVPNARCLRCHPTVDPRMTGFSHAKHASNRLCSACHATVGHDVTLAALQQAGILNRSAVYRNLRAASYESSQVVIDGGAADLAGHKTVVCSRCHVMSKTACSSCHTPGHQPRGECSTCHLPGEKFVFTHPLSGVDCTMCHKPPTPHPTATDCTRCHQKPGVSWAYEHTKGLTCTDCHTPPAKHRSGTCTLCHKKPGVTWAFTHPANGVNCLTCHQPPANHRAGTCAKCHHNAGVSWAFVHPSIDSACTNCHARPANMPAGPCSTCHTNPGVNWKFTHPGLSADCESCHKRPANMPAGQCSNCHKHPGVDWKPTL